MLKLQMVSQPFRVPSPGKVGAGPLCARRLPWGGWLCSHRGRHKCDH